MLSVCYKEDNIGNGGACTSKQTSCLSKSFFDISSSPSEGHGVDDILKAFVSEVVVKSTNQARPVTVTEHSSVGGGWSDAELLSHEFCKFFLLCKVALGDAVRCV